MGEGEIHGAMNGAWNGGGHLPPGSVPSDFYCRETP